MVNAFARKHLAVELRPRACADDERAAVRPYDDGAPFRRRTGGGPHVQIQAVLAHWLDVDLGPRREADVPHRLHTSRSEPLPFSHAGPRRRGLRRLPAPRADRWRGEWDAFEHPDTGL